MIIFDEDRPSDSPFVERVWRCHSEGAAPFLSIAASRCELVVSRLHGKVTMTVRGPETRATSLGDCPGDGEWLGILLKQGVSILDTVEQAGYFDQPHLTRSLKYLIGQTPAQILEKSRPEQMPFLYKTTPFE